MSQRIAHSDWTANNSVDRWTVIRTLGTNSEGYNQIGVHVQAEYQASGKAPAAKVAGRRNLSPSVSPTQPAKKGIASSQKQPSKGERYRVSALPNGGMLYLE